MDVMIYTSDPDNVDPAEIARAIEGANYFVASVNVNDGERTWEMGEAEDTFAYTATHRSTADGSDAMLVSQSEETITLVNEDGFEWTDPKSQWRPITD